MPLFCKQSEAIKSLAASFGSNGKDASIAKLMDIERSYPLKSR